MTRRADPWTDGEDRSDGSEHRADGGEEIKEEIEEEIDAGGPFLPQQLTVFGHAIRTRVPLRALGALAAVALVAAVVHTEATRGVVTNGIPTSIQAGTGQLSPFDRITALERQQGLNDHIRQISPPGTCTPVPIGHSPERAVLTVVRRMVVGATAVDAGRTLDQFTGLCALQVRAKGPGQLRVVVVIAAPPPHTADSTLDALEIGIETDGGVTTEYAQQTTHTGWSVLIGVIGPSQLLPRMRDLTIAVGTPEMLW